MKIQTYIYLILIGLLTPVMFCAQSTDHNYISTRTYQNDSSTVYLDAIQYFDGLGRPIQSVQRGVTPNKQDLVSIQEYDDFGRESNTWLPGVSSTNGAFVASEGLKNTIKTSSLYGNDQKPFSHPVYESSPLNRVFKQFGSGEDWHNKGKAVSTDYLTNIITNDSLNCIYYSISETSQRDTILTLTKETGYNTGELYVTRSTDEAGNISYEFKDKLGQVLLTRQIENGERLDTYYIYDDFGNLRVVLPPIASQNLKNESSWSSQTDNSLKGYAYLYKYDERNNCIAKKLPGCDWIYYIYDKTDRLILSQDGEQRKKNRNEWTINIYDIFGRATLSGIIDDTDFYLDDEYETGIIQTALSSDKITECVALGEIAFIAEYTNDINNYGYKINLVNCKALELSPTDNAVFQINSLQKYYTINYYDNYDFLNLIPDSASYIYDPSKESDSFGKRYDDGKGYEAKTLLTGTITSTYGSDGNTELYSVMYYDNRQRLIQTHSTNHLNGVDRTYTAYNFTGQPTKMQTVQRVVLKNGQTKETSELYTYSYDHAGRLLETKHKLNNESELILAKNEYDELGRLKKINKGGVSSLPTEYQYNIRSWTTNISNSHFRQKLYYNESNGNNTPQYNGNISAIEWNKGVDNSRRAYNFSYDQLSRLRAANYTGQANEKYGTSYSYDKHGNILTLERQGKKDAGDSQTSWGVVDQLSFTYSGNQLKTIIDTGINVGINESADFKGNATGSVHYTFNRNGAMTQDLNKGIDAIQYNSLNLPQEMVINSSSARAKNYYTYSASGVKLRVEQRYDPDLITNPVMGTNPGNDGLSKSKITDYVGNKIYENGELKKILVDGGYYDYEKQEYYFYIQDHLGNNRVVVNQNDSVVQRSDYYPFGMEFADNSGNDQPYKYNDKELDKMHGLNMYDYSARYVDPAYGRFTSVDPLAEKYYSCSPYVYVANNPLKFIDPTGMSYTYNWDTGEYEHTDKDGNTKTVSYEEALKKSGATKNSKTYDISTQQGRSSLINNLNIKGLINNVSEAFINLFSIKEEKKTPEGEKYTTYTARDYENSGPDYLGVNVGYSTTFWGTPGLSHSFDFNIGYIKKDGWVIFPTIKHSSGFDFSVGIGITAGKYLGKGSPNGKSLEGWGTYASYTRGIMSYGYSNGYDDKLNRIWNFGTIGVGKGVSKVWGSQFGITQTVKPGYFRNLGN